MQSRFNAQAIASQCLDLITLSECGEAHLMLNENGEALAGIVKDFSNHYDGRLKLHLYDGRYVSWRLPQHVIDAVSNIIRVDGNSGTTAPKGWDYV